MTDTTCHVSISLDGFIAGPDQSRENPLGVGGLELHRWHLGDGRATEADATASDWLGRPRGAYIMGRNMFGPIRGEWDEDWRGWWGDNPPYHAPSSSSPIAHEPIEMAGGTTFHFSRTGFEPVCTGVRGGEGAGHPHRGRGLDRPPGARRRCRRRTHARHRSRAARSG